MQIRSLTLVLTDACNFSCSYCYRRGSRDPAAMSRADLEEILLFFCLT